MVRCIQIAVVSALLCCGAVVSIAAAQQSQNPPTSTANQTTPSQASAPPEQNSSESPAQPQAQPQSPPSTPSPDQAAPQSGPEAKPKDTVTAPKKPAARLSTRKKPVAKKSAKSQPGKVVVRNGGAKDNSVQLSPAMTHEQALHSKETIAQLLATTDANIKTVAAQQLSPGQQATLDQIHAYVRQSKAASASGDLARAHTLAYKAHLLSDELAARQ